MSQGYRGDGTTGATYSVLKCLPNIDINIELRLGVLHDVHDAALTRL